MTTSSTDRVRLHKRMAQLGVASRRASEALIAQGRVKVNGRVVTEVGTSVGPKDRISVDGHEVSVPSSAIAIVLNKPTGIICTKKDPEGRRTIYDLLPAELPHLAYVGRLDINTEGVLVMTSDGDLAQGLMRPDSAVPRVYEVKIRGRLTPDEQRRLERGIPLDDRPTRPVAVDRIPTTSKHDWLRVTLFEGKNRHVHRILEAVGHSVTRLRRVSFGTVDAAGLALGEYRFLSEAEVESLRRFL